MKRNTLVLGIGARDPGHFWLGRMANRKYRQQAAERRMSDAAKGELVAATGGDPQAALTSMVGKMAPDFALEDLNGQKGLALQLQGKSRTINFWATWCGPCKLETPWLVDLRNQYAAKGFEILGTRPMTSTATTAKRLTRRRRKSPASSSRCTCPTRC